MTEVRHRRKVRNYLLQPGFQLKYTLMVVIVTGAVATILGYFAYRYSSSQVEIAALEDLESELAMGNDISDKLALDLEQAVQNHKMNVLTAIVSGVLLLTLALGITGILITHRVVGPAYRLRRLFDVLGTGRLKVDGTIRDGDELKEVFESFQQMVESLRTMRQEEIQHLDAAIGYAKEAGISERTVQDLEWIRDRVKNSLQ